MFDNIDILKSSVALLINKCPSNKDIDILRNGYIEEIEI
jgi:hypothetical protein